MATESPIRITESSRTWASLKETPGYGSPSANIAIDELGLLLNRQTYQGNGRTLVPSRSGSAPPSMEGSIAAAKNIMSDQNFNLNASLASINSSIGSYVSGEKLRVDQAYVASSSAKMNPRLTPTMIPRDNRRLVRHIGTAGYDRRLTTSDDFIRDSLSTSHSKLPTHREEPEDDRSDQLTPANWPDKSISFSSLSETSPCQLHSVSRMTEDDITHSKSPVYSQDPSLSLESIEKVGGAGYLAPICSADVMLQSSHPDPTGSVSSSTSVTTLRNTSSKPNLHKRLSITTDCHLGDHISNTTVTNTNSANIDSNINYTSSSSLDPNHPHTYQHNMVQEQVAHEQRYKLEVQNSQSEMSSREINHSYIGSDQFFHGPSNYSGAEVRPVGQSSGFGPPLYATAAADHMNSSTLLYQNQHPSSYFSPQYTLSAYTFQSEGLSPYIAGYVPQAVVPVTYDTAVRPNFSPQASSFSGITSHGINLQHLNNYYGQCGFPMQPSLTDPFRFHYFQRPFGDAYGLPVQFSYIPPRNGATGSSLTAINLPKVSIFPDFSTDQKFQNQGSMGQVYMNPGRAGFPYYVGGLRDTGLLHFPTAAAASPVLPGSPVNGNSCVGGTHELRFSPRLTRNPGISSGWAGPRGPDGIKSLSFLEELKSGKGRRLELSDIVGHIIEFSGDQHGSRFIQQKLENCSFEEKESVFKEVLPNTSKLMTDVFGNYVIQKFFEYGSLEQRKNLANQLAGQILPLSLQMYGCRVIQKALDVIEPEQKIKLVQELDGHVIRCVRDQNGNHVIQKCIETIPIHEIEFIISSFRGQVAQLSTHPYGCRVIQRVLEHCPDDLQSQFIVDEILDSVCSLAQDQYGNYVTQHVLERGKPPERHLIITKLSGHIVQLSQHKFASNVVEKCLEYGDSTSMAIIIGDIIGQGDGNDNLLTMVKDQYANYVIQKIIQTCSGDQKEMLLCRIRTHLNSLKKYTYGKHIAARFEQLYGEELKTEEADSLTE